MTGKSVDNTYSYLFTCEVKDMQQVENDIKSEFSTMREQENREIYFFNKPLFDGYVAFIKNHKLFIKELFTKPDDKKPIVRIVKRTAPTLEERNMTSRDVLQRAQRVSNDEFYTRYEDVEKELIMYPNEIWADKVVFCNCDDAVGEDKRNTSAFALYFLKNFKGLKLKKLICTHYGNPVDLFNAGSKGYIFTKDGYKEFRESPKGYTGSFDDPVSLKILKDDADIVCTNPPFSRMSDFWKITVDSGKKFIIISNISNVVTRAFIPHFYENKVWAGFNEIDWFLTPKKELTRAAGYWYTNIPITDRPKYKQLKIMPLKDIPDKYKKYDDLGTLLVDNCYIPSDYQKPFAVSARAILNGLLEKGYRLIKDKEYYPYIGRKRCFARVLVQKAEYVGQNEEEAPMLTFIEQHEKPRLIS